MIVSEVRTSGLASKGYSLLCTSECFIQHILGSGPYDIGIERGGGISDMRYCVIVSLIATDARHVVELTVVQQEGLSYGTPHRPSSPI